MPHFAQSEEAILRPILNSLSGLDHDLANGLRLTQPDDFGIDSLPCQEVMVLPVTSNPVVFYATQSLANENSIRRRHFGHDSRLSQPGWEDGL